jgi:fructose-1,6-bisphosphatase/inositol monophosphatase family enzyme
MIDRHVILMHRAVRKAAVRLVTLIEKPEMVTHVRKADRSWVLSLDLEANQVITRELRGSGVSLISEEEGDTHRWIGAPGTFFLIDPLDGTSVCRRFMNERNGQLGFGPIVGLVEDGIVQAVAFAHISRGLIFCAQAGKGLTLSPISDSAEVIRIGSPRSQATELSECLMLFHIGSRTETMLAYELRHRAVIDNAYRFGGFANDSCRLALGYEDIQLQLSLCAWDLCATLIAQEAGFSVWLDPFGVPTKLENWKIKENNPVLVCPPNVAEQLIKVMGELVSEEKTTGSL